MKSVRLLVLLGNFVLLSIVAYIGVGFWVIPDFFSETSVEKINPKEILRDRPKKTVVRYQDYGVLRDLAKDFEIIVPPPEPEKPDRLNIEIDGVVFNKKNPAKSGAHVKVKNKPRFFLVGDNEKLASDMPYYLREIIEVKPDQEYTLVFEHENGEEKAEAKYKRK